MNQLTKQHYQAIVSRGLINDKTTLKDFITKLVEEFEELANEAYKKDQGLENNFEMEAIDVSGVVFNMLIHLGYDVEKLYKQNIEYQENRKD